MQNPIHEQLVLNPQARLSLIITTPVHNQGLQHLHFTPSHEALTSPQVFQPFSDLLRSLELLSQRQSLALCPEISQEHIQMLQTLKLLVPADQIAQQPLFMPALNQPPGLIPELGKLPASLQWNPNYYFQTEAEPPPELHEQLAGWQYLPQQRPLLWVKPPEQTSWFPLWLTTAQIQQLEHSFQHPPEKLSSEARTLLYQAGLLIPTELSTFFTTEAKTFLAQNHYLVLRKLLPPLQLGALRTYLRQLHQQGFFQRGDLLVQEREYIHNDPVIRFLQQQIFRHLQPLFSQAVKPSYTYLTLYPPGVSMVKHTDREQCAWNMSLVLDMETLVPTENSWPLYLQTAQGQQAIHLNLGDAVLYPGYHMPHWREPADQAVAVALFHFVAEDYSGALA